MKFKLIISKNDGQEIHHFEGVMKDANARIRYIKTDPDLINFSLFEIKATREKFLKGFGIIENGASCPRDAIKEISRGSMALKESEKRAYARAENPKRRIR